MRMTAEFTSCLLDHFTDAACIKRSTLVRYVTRVCCVNCAAVTGYGRAFYVSSVWSAMTWKWSFLLFLYSRNYRRLYELRTGICADVGYHTV